MKTSIIPQNTERGTTLKGGLLTNLFRNGLFKRLNTLEFGQITLVENVEEFRFGRCTEEFPTPVKLIVHSTEFYSDIALGGSVGAGEAFIHGFWSCDDLTLLIRILLKNRHALDAMDSSLSRIKTPLHKLMHWYNRNTKNGSRRNIESHYDLGNELFKTFLDESMMYSSAVYEEKNYDLEKAAFAKVDRICKKLDLKPGDHVLEIGTGWGGFAIHAAKYYGCRVTTTTISREQFVHARDRVKEEGLTDKVTLLLEDYRDLSGQYDKLVSIEMIEAIGHQYLDTYFDTCNRLLKPHGMMLLQAITIADQRYETAKNTVDFIKRFIFPGGFLPSVAAMADSIARKTDMRIYHLEDIGEHYATTLRHWRQRFFSRIDDVRQLGYPDSFVRMWDFYLSYCEGGFLERVIGTAQILTIKPENRRDPVTPVI
ncbi:MAG: class I SAM-dependent methyltransferase [Gammaproteobacteria bacterium]|nr:class I SAM-dependent methyltransferase [Gammaproteobacteria bacterium]